MMNEWKMTPNLIAICLAIVFRSVAANPVVETQQNDTTMQHISSGTIKTTQEFYNNLSRSTSPPDNLTSQPSIDSKFDSINQEATMDIYEEKEPRYIGIAIGFGVCVLLLLLSACAVFLINLRHGDTMFKLKMVNGYQSKKDDDGKFARLPSQKQEHRPSRVHTMIHVDRINSGTSNTSC